MKDYGRDKHVCRLTSKYLLDCIKHNAIKVSILVNDAFEFEILKTVFQNNGIEFDSVNDVYPIYVCNSYDGSLFCSTVKGLGEYFEVGDFK